MYFSKMNLIDGFRQKNELLNTLSTVNSVSSQKYMEVWLRRETLFKFWTAVPSRSVRWQCFESFFIYFFFFFIAINGVLCTYIAPGPINN